jgi:hypothetical protein
MRFFPNSATLCSLGMRATCALFAVSSWAQSTAPLGELFASEPGTPALAQPAGPGMSVLPGSEVSAGIAPATLKLFRGGQVRVCPKSNLNINASGRGLMVGMNSGAIEVDYRLDQGATDLVLTPDFHIRLVGPGAYHFALGTNSKGDTCIKPLPGNSAGILFSELIGTDSYGVGPNEGAMFLSGKLASRTPLTGDCGCAAPAAPVLQADVSTPLPPQRQGSAHLEVNAPFVFSASAAGDARPNVVARLRFSSLPNVFFLQDAPVPVVLVEDPVVQVSTKGPETKGADTPSPEKMPAEPEQQTQKQKKGLFARVRGFFGSIFHR